MTVRIEAPARKWRPAQGHTIVVEKSTLPVRTAETVKAILNAAQEVAGAGALKTFSVLPTLNFWLRARRSPIWKPLIAS